MQNFDSLDSLGINSEESDDFKRFFYQWPSMNNQFLNDQRDGDNFDNFDFENFKREEPAQRFGYQENSQEEIARRAEQKKRPEQSSTGLFEKELQFGEKQDQMEARVEEPQEPIKEIKCKNQTKNLLINFRAFFCDWIRTQNPQAESDPFFQNFAYKTSVNRKDYEELFRNNRYRQVISEMFQQRFLQRQFQLSRSSNAVRPVYLKKISVFKKAFEKKWFPRIR